VTHDFCFFRLEISLPDFDLFFERGTRTNCSSCFFFEELLGDIKLLYHG